MIEVLDERFEVVSHSRYLLDELPPTIAELGTRGLSASVTMTTSDDPADQLLALAGRQPASR